MRLYSGAIGLALFAILSGCVGKLETRPNRAVTSLSEARSGMSYALPKVQYEVKLTRALAECPGEPDPDDATKLTALKFSITATATPTYVAGESYEVDYLKLAGWLRTANFEIKLYPNGTLKSLGAGAEDRTGPVLANIAKTAISVATIAGLSAAVPPSKIKPQAGGATAVACKLTVADQVRAARALEKDLKDQAKKLEPLEATAERFKAAGSARLIDDAGRAAFMKLFDDIKVIQDAIVLDKAKLEKLNDALSVTETIQWDGGVTNADYEKAYPLSAAQSAKLSDLLEVNTAMAPGPAAGSDPADQKRRTLMPACYGTTANIPNCLNQQLNLRSGIHLVRDLKVCDDPECLKAGKGTVNARDEQPDSGIFVRDAQDGQLLFCREAVLPVPGPAPGPTPAPPAPVANGQVQGNGTPTVGQGGQGQAGTQGGVLDGANAQPGLIVNAPASVPITIPGETVCKLKFDEAKIAPANFPQFGQLRFLPLRVGTFQARELAVSMTETGRIDTYSYKSTKAPAETLTATTADIAGQVATFMEARETEKRDDAKYERENEIALIQAQIDTLTKQAELEKLQSPEVDPLKSTRDETAAIEADVALLKAKLELLKAEAALAAGVS